jgi:hypothetical protein
MSLVNLIVVFIVVGLLLWLVNQFIPMEPRVKSIMNAVVIILLVLWVISLFFPGLSGIRVGR